MSNQRTSNPLDYLRRYPPIDEFDHPVWVRLLAQVPAWLALWFLWRFM